MMGINPDMQNSASYIKGWLKPLEDNPEWVVKAASKAQKAVQMIVGEEVA